MGTDLDDAKHLVEQDAHLAIGNPKLGRTHNETFFQDALSL